MAMEIRKQTPPAFAQPLWNGSSIKWTHNSYPWGNKALETLSSLSGYVPLVAERGAKVLLRCGGELVSLLQNIRGIDKVLSYSEQLPDFDMYCPIATLPLLFGTTLRCYSGSNTLCWGPPINN